MTSIWLALALIFSGPPQTDPTTAQPSSVRRPNLEAHREAAIQINDLAGRIRSEADARELTDAIATMFAEHLPPAWATQSIRNRVVRAEYEAVSEPSQLIPEQRIADIWNEYVREIGAPEEALVSTAEIHNMRDAGYAGGKLMWERGNQTIWTMPNVYAVGADGKVAGGCRTIEALRVLYELDNLFINVRRARDRLQKGILASNLIAEIQQRPKSSHKTTARLTAFTDENPVGPAEYRYVAKQGKARFDQLLEKLFNELLPQ